MKIVQVANYISRDSRAGGPATVALANHRSFLKNALDASLIAISDSNTTYEEGVYLHKGRKVLPSNDLGGFWSFRFAWRAYLELRAADVVHIHFGRDLASLTCALLSVLVRKPFFIQPHGMLHNSKPLRNRILDGLVVKWITKRSQGVFVLSKQEQEHLIRNGYAKAPQTIRVINGVSISQFPSKFARTKITFVGRMHKIKQPMLFAQVAKSLTFEFPSLSFEMYGPDGGEVKELLNSTSGYKNISYKGVLPNEEILEVFQRTKVLLVTSLEEVFPMVVVEAATRGAAVLVMNDFGISDLVQDLQIGSVSERELDAIQNKLRIMLRQIINHDELSQRASGVFNIDSVTAKFLIEYRSRISTFGNK
jgi:glycosyltransferase involved in cell wall biosynthesis